MTKFSSLRAALLCSALLLFLLPTASAVAVTPPQVFPFYGVCSDCEGTVYAELQLYHTYVIGDPILPEHFMTFYYGGSNLMDSYMIYQGDLVSIGGVMTGIPGTEEFYIQSYREAEQPEGLNGLQIAPDSYYFFSCASGSSLLACEGYPDGYWETGTGFLFKPRDYGDGHAWNGGEIPEPGTFVLLAAGLAVIGLTRRLRR